MLEIENLSHQFGGRSVLREVSLRLAPGEYVAIVDKSGVGKSTPRTPIAGLDRPDDRHACRRRCVFEQWLPANRRRARVHDQRTHRA